MCVSKYDTMYVGFSLSDWEIRSNQLGHYLKKKTHYVLSRSKMEKEVEAKFLLRRLI